ncbi:hypothetical protein [Desulfonatronum thioautotrophicum]|uniref:hypothetical protein n=1 Tax=Desulfonatronum thioautotrophicum TaxID=617001 RepID=UPI0005EB368C|nr:hypothetical protein [Desulfonatronum thioautotrophicum]
MPHRPNPPSHCRRCGTCCRKGGPALHQADLALLRDKSIHRADLITLRVGEPVHDQVKGQIILLDAECIKIRSQDETGCCFHQPAPARQDIPNGSTTPPQGHCAIHENKPVECAALKCWDTTDLALAAGTPRLSRLEILGKDNAMAELIRDHETHCAVADLLRHLQTPTQKSAEHLRHATTYDAALRDLLQEKAAVPADHLPFLLGRPLSEVIQSLKRWLAMH